LKTLFIISMIPPAFQYILLGSCGSHAPNSQMFQQNSLCCNFCFLHSRLCGSPSANQYYIPDLSQQHSPHFSGDIRINININVIRNRMLDHQSTPGCSQPISGRSTELPLATKVIMPDSVPSLMSVDRGDSTNMRDNHDVTKPKQVPNPPVFFSSGSELKPDPPETISLIPDHGKKRNVLAESFFRRIGEVICKVLKGVPLGIEDLELSSQQIEVILTFLVRKFNIQSLEV